MNEEIIKIIENNSKIIAQKVLDQVKIANNEDVVYHLNYLSEALYSHDFTIFENYILWALELYENLDILKSSLNIINLEIKKLLPKEISDIADEYIKKGIEKINTNYQKDESFISKDLPYADIANSYLESLLKANRQEATKLILDSIDKKGITIKEIYIYVFQTVLYEIGRLWHTKKVTVAQEHFCSAATERIMSQLYANIFNTNKTGLFYLGTCMSGELHQIGARMVADFFEMEGWDTYYLGANVPIQSILQAIIDYKANILGISMAMSFYKTKLNELIKAINISKQASQISKDLKIIVGGYFFLQNENSWQSFGVDGFAKNAEEALILSNKMQNINNKS